MLLLRHMTQERPPVQESENTHEDTSEQLNATYEHSVAVDPKAMEDLENLERDIKFKTSDTAEAIRKAQAKKGSVIETWDPKPETKYEAPVKQASHPLRNRLMAGVIGLATMLGFQSKATAAELPEDSVKNKIENPNENIVIREGLTIREISPNERQEWNAFIDFVQAKEKEFGGLEKLDKNQALARKLFGEYQKIHPGTSINYNMVASVQYEMQKLRQSVQGFAQRRNDPNANKLMGFISEVDGFFGDNTAQSKFPFMIEDQYHNNNLVSSKNLGLVNSNLETSSKTQLKKKIPDGAKIVDNEFYEDPQTGDLVKYK